MTLRFVFVGKTRNAQLGYLIGDYLDRVRRFLRIDVTEIRDKEAAGPDLDRLRKKQGEEILSKTESDPFLILLDEHGDELTSRELARLIEKHRLAGTKMITFVTGGFAGVSDQVKKRADQRLALSRMTLTRDMARLILVEQVYRAFTIIMGLPYQK